MRVGAAIATVILFVGLVAGCGSSSAATGAAVRGTAGFEEEGFFEVGGPGPPPADGTAPLHGAQLEEAEARHVWEGEMVAGEEGWVRSAVGVFWTEDGGQAWRSITPPVPDVAAIQGVYFADPRRGWALYETGG